MPRHKHADLIIAWANGAQIEVRTKPLVTNWRPVKEVFPNLESPVWYEDFEYRIKPEPKPDVVRYAIAAVDTVYVCNEEYRPTDNLRLTFDGETLKLKSAEVL